MLEQRVQVVAEALEDDALVLVMHERVLHLDDVVLLRAFLQRLQDLELDLRLHVERLLALDDLDRHVRFALRVERLDHAPERALAEHRQHLISIVQQLARDDDVIVIRII